MNFFIKGFFSKCDQICSFLRIWSHLLKKFLMENFIFCAVFAKTNSFTCFSRISNSKLEIIQRFRGRWVGFKGLKAVYWSALILFMQKLDINMFVMENFMSVKDYHRLHLKIQLVAKQIKNWRIIFTSFAII